MSNIRVLPDHLVNRIAAGEVVERPASVVKELVENSLDSGATRIEVDLTLGGRSLVRVADDGCGMDADDALLALERHATSKIATVDDLAQIATLGFRGEALPAIAAVSSFTLTTCADPAQGGVRVVVEGGRVVAVEGAARPRGTTVEVRELFRFHPARRKFLHAPETELRHAQEIVVGAALARPDVAFVLRHGGRELLELMAAADLAARAEGALRRRGQGVLRRFEIRGETIAVSGVIVAGEGSGRPQLYLLVNRRVVRDRLLTGAVLRVLREAGAGFSGARVALEVELAPEEVDVNVHPAKAEVRFARPSQVFAAVERAVRQGVAAAQGRVDVRRVEPHEGSWTREPYRTYDAPHPPPSGLLPHPVWGATEPFEPATPGAKAGGDTGRRPSGARSRQPDTPFGRLIGQYRDSFLLLEDDQGLVIVDQHVAHERVLFDRIRRQLSGREVAPAQRLLEPLVLEVGEAMAGAVGRVAPLLDRIGLEAAVFGPGTIRVDSLPVGLGADEATRLLEEILDRATALDSSPEGAATAVEEHLAASLACRAAIKVNHGLAPEAQRALLEDLARSDHPYRCPHGRPIVLRLGQDEMERRLGRR